jgi:ABC-type ATPase with predicted acetyltransferase domain
MSQLWQQNKDELLKVASTKGSTVPTRVTTNNIVKVLEDFIADPTIKTLPKYKSAIKYAKENIASFKKQMSYDVEQVQNMITKLNKSFGDEGIKSEVDLLIANNFRENMDDVVEGVLGASTKGLREQYGSYRKMIDSISRRAAKESGKSTGGILDVAKIFTVDDLLRGAMGDTKSLVSGVVQRSWLEKIRRSNLPDNIIKDMFKQVDDIVSKANKYKIDLNPKK